MDEQQTLETHLKLVLEKNKVLNLTRISSWEEGMLLHVKDSLLGVSAINEAPEGAYLDMGTGGGYPGVPVAIVTHRNTLLVDSVGKKVKAVQEMADELCLDNVSTWAGRLEDLAKEKPCAFAVASARALSKLSVLMELSSPLLQNKGRLVCYKAKVDEEEMSHALALQKKLNMWVIDDKSYQLESDEGEVFTRRIIVFERRGRAELKLPRKVGDAQRKPL